MRYFPRLNEVMWSRDAKQFDSCDLPEDVSQWHGLPAFPGAVMRLCRWIIMPDVAAGCCMVAVSTSVV